MPELFGHLEADVAAAHNNRATGLAILDPRHDVLHVGDVAHGKVAWAVNARNWRAQRRGTGGQNQRVVRLFIFAAGRQFADFDNLRRAVNGKDFGADADVEVEPGAESIGRLEK